MNCRRVAALPIVYMFKEAHCMQKGCGALPIRFGNEEGA